MNLLYLTLHYKLIWPKARILRYLVRIILTEIFHVPNQPNINLKQIVYKNMLFRHKVTIEKLLITIETTKALLLLQCYGVP